MSNLTKRCTHPTLKPWSDGFTSKLKILFTLFLWITFLIPAKLSAQIIIDGNPSDWPSVLNNASNVKKAFKHDPFDTLHVDDQWTGGSQDGDASPSADWHWINGNSNDKGDIANAGAVLLGCNLYFFGDRTATNGDAQIGFWFFVGDVHQTGSGDTSSGFVGEHTNGDLLIISNFTNGGGNARPTVYQWQGKTASLPGGLVKIDSTLVGAAMATNTTTYNVPGGVSGTTMYNGQQWIFHPKSGSNGTYPVPLFFEGTLNVCALPGGDLCFASFLLETRNSQSISASLQDLVAGSFSGVPPPPSVTPAAKCFDGAGATLTATCSGTNTCVWYAAATGGNPLGAADGVSGCSITTPSAPGTYIYYAACTDGQCTSNRVPDTAKIYGIPSVNGLITLATGVTLTSDDHYGIELGLNNTAAFTASASGGTSPYTYTWTPLTTLGSNVTFSPTTSTSTGNATLTFSSINPPLELFYDFKVVTVDAHGCTAADTVRIVPTATLPSCEIYGPKPVCANTTGLIYVYGHDDGTTKTPFLLNTSEFSYHWSITGNGTITSAADNKDSVTVSSTGSGSFILTMTIHNLPPGILPDVQCIYSVPVEAVTATEDSTAVTCNGGSDGSITLTFSGGTSPYQINFNGGGFVTQTSPKTYTGLTAGTYTWVIQDSVGCTASGSTTVNQPTALVVSEDSTNATCSGNNDGSVTLTFSGGTGPYQVNFNGGGFATQTSPKTYGSLAAGTYTWVVQDANGCNKSGSTIVGQPSTLNASADSTDVTCNGGSDGSVTLTFSGGTGPYQVNFNGGGFVTQTSPKTYTGLTAGTYTWSVKDANGCTVSGSEDVHQPDALLVSEDSTMVSCNGGSDGSVTLTFSGGTGPYQVNFNGGGLTTQTSPHTYTGLTAGTYTWVVQDAHGCTKSGSTVVGQPDALVVSEDSTKVSCNGGSDGSVTLTFSGGTGPYQVNFNGGGLTVQTSPHTYTGLTAGTYTWVVQDANGCTKSGSTIVGQPDALIVSEDSTSVTCNGGSDGSVTLTFSGGTGPYQVNFNGGGLVTQTSPKVYTGLSAGTYTWTVQDANGCSKSGSTIVGQPDALLVSEDSTNVTCNGGSDGSVTLTFSGGTGPYQVNFNGGGFTAQTSPHTYTGLTAGTYSWTVQDANGCNLSGSTIVGQPDALSCNLTSPSANPACSSTGNQVTGTVTGGTSGYTCSASFDATGVAAGWSVTGCDVTGSSITVTYSSGTTASTVLTVVITDANGCTSNCTVTLSCAGTGQACTPGFWKTHPEVWDNTNDFVVNNMPGDLTDPVTPGGTFVTTTNFWTYFAIPVGQCSISNNPNLTMNGAEALGGGKCIALARQGVAALLGAAAFPGQFPYPAGSSDFASLYTLIRNAFLACDCSSLATTLANINALDSTGDFCSQLAKLPQVLSTAFIGSPMLNVTNLYVNAFPNPYGNEVTFNIISPVSGHASLEIYDMVGKRLKVVYTGLLEANRGHTVKYKVSTLQHVPLIYKLTVAGKTAVGKLIPGDRNANF